MILPRIACLVFQLTFIALFANLPAFGKVSERPNIWVSSSGRTAILEKIETHSWAADLHAELKARADAGLASYELDPVAYLKGFHFDGVVEKTGHPRLMIIERDPPESPGLAARRATMQRLQDGIDCGVLYFLHGDERYIKLTADVLATYLRGVEDVEPSLRHNGGLLYPSNHLKEARIFGAQVPILYDFAHPYLTRGGTVHNLASSQREAFPFELAQTVFRHYVERAINTGLIDCNWPALELTSLLNNTLALEDAKERNKYLRYTLDQDTRTQDSLKRFAEIYRESGGVWPEPQGYAAGVGLFSCYAMTVLERRDPELKLGQKYPEPANSLIRMETLRFPNGDVPTLGDAHGPRDHKPQFEAFEFAYHLAKVGGREDDANKYGGLLLNSIAAGAYDRSILQARNFKAAPYYVPLQLLWQEPELVGSFELGGLPRTDQIKFAGLFLQRNLPAAEQVEQGLMTFMAAGHFIHAHATGLHAEFYGKGEVLGLRAGTGIYTSPVHNDYYALWASGNTVISNGASATAGGWVDRAIHQAELASIEPAFGEEPISPYHSFTTGSFFDEHNRVAPAKHQRTLAIVRTSPKTGYYIDLFRAHSDHDTQFHDYLYHNVGERLTISALNGTELDFEKDPTRFVDPNFEQKHKRYHYQHPGWHYLENAKTATIPDGGVTARFVASAFDTGPHSMNVHIPSLHQREITTVTGPPSLSSKGAYLKKETPAFVIRQNGSAWETPFAAIYEPVLGDASNASIKSVNTLSQDDQFVGLKVSSIVDNHSIEQHILILEPGQSYENTELDLKFQGHFAILTTSSDGSGSLYLGDGDSLSYQDKKLAGPSAYREW